MGLLSDIKVLDFSHLAGPFATQSTWHYGAEVFKNKNIRKMILDIGIFNKKLEKFSTWHGIKIKDHLVGKDELKKLYTKDG